MIKKATFLFGMVLIFTTISKAQIFKLDGLYIAGGYGFGAATIEDNLNISIGSSVKYNSYQNYSIGPIALQGEYGISSRLGIAFHVANMHSFEKGSYSEQIWNPNTRTFENHFVTFNNAKHVTGMSVRINNHFSKSEKLDVYWGVGLGQNKTRYKITTTGAHASVNPYSDSPIFAELYLGGRAYFNEHWGAYAEVGFMKTFVIAGFVWRNHK
ncbi:MAG: hypothetical protein SGJ10_08490 [Bacteroidota bacterium]|nr:hypothetical protein [Bacteroidota bacterium]